MNLAMFIVSGDYGFSKEDSEGEAFLGDHTHWGLKAIVIAVVLSLLVGFGSQPSKPQRVEKMRPPPYGPVTPYER